MKLPIGSIIILDSISLNYSVKNSMYRVVGETEHTVLITRLKDNGEAYDEQDIDRVKKTSVIAILSDISDFEPFRLMNQEINEKWNAYNEIKNKYDLKMKSMKNDLRRKIA